MPTWAHRYFAIEVAHDKDYVASVISYYLDLTGPSEVVQAACASSLVAVARGVQAIRLGLCDVALCGGASFSADDAIRAVEGMIWSPEGTCKPYADDASGTVPADGAAIVVITSRPCARTYAEVRGVAVNNDGRRKSAFSQPSCEAQVEVVRAALANAKTSPAEVDYVEGHGTGTKIGDPIELQALAEVHARLVDASPSTCTRQPWDGSRNGFRPTGAPHAAYRFAHRALGRLTRARRSHARRCTMDGRRRARRCLSGRSRGTLGTPTRQPASQVLSRLAWPCTTARCRPQPTHISRRRSSSGQPSRCASRQPRRSAYGASA